MSSPPEPFRDRVRAVIAEHAPEGFRGLGSLDPEEAEAFAERWRKVLYDNGLLGLTWPVEYGGGGRSIEDAIAAAEELTRAGLPLGVATDGFGMRLLGNTLLHWGSEVQKAHYLPRILSGEDRWCQGYSEPGAGSDLAGLSTTAVLDGDEWRVNGQKVWTSAGHVADHIFVLCRTNLDAPKHKGISLLLMDLRQPGVEVRPIRMMSGGSDFNEVFFTDARVPAGDVVGGIDNGWSVAMTVLGYERGENTATEVIRFEAECDRLLVLARERGRSQDPRIRQRLARSYTKVQIMRYLGEQVKADLLAGRTPGPGSSINKLFWSEHHQEITELALDILGPDGVAPTGHAPLIVFGPDEAKASNTTASWATIFLNARAGTIYAGTSEVQRTIVAERVLGLPKEPR
ncbi:MAG: acyl-CoA dehydrogenase family protein [Acidimicrobiales bacterium]